MGKKTDRQRRAQNYVPVRPLASLKDRVEAVAVEQEDGTFLVPSELAAELARVQGEHDAKKLAISRGRTFGRGKLAGSVKRRR